MRQIEDKKRKREIEVRCKKIALLVVGLCILFGGIAHFTNKNKEKKEVQTTNPSVKTLQEEPNTEETDYTEEQVKKFKKTKRGRKILAMICTNRFISLPYRLRQCVSDISGTVGSTVICDCSQIECYFLCIFYDQS